jgi:TolB-like protein
VQDRLSDVFISYARASAKQARAAADALRTAGYSVWLDEDLPAHRAFTAEIEQQLSAAKAALVIWSAEAMMSDWVLSEANRAREAHKLVQLTVDGARLPMPFDQIQCADLVGWKGDPAAAGWLKVVNSVGALAGPASQDVNPRDVGQVSAPPKPSVRRWPALLAVAAALVIVVAGGGWWFLTRPPALPPSRVAVLPFDTPGAQGADAFAAGLQDEILGALSNDHVETVSRTESAALRGPTASAAIGRLGVGLLLDGSVEQANGSITVRLHLDDAEKGAVVWSEGFSRSTAEAEPLQAEVAAKVARVTTQALGARAAGVTDPSTLSDFVTGDEHQRFDLSHGSDSADPFFRRVVARAPRFAGGYAFLAIAEAFQSREQDNPRAAELRASAQRDAKEAIRLDPKGYDGYLALAMLTPPDKDYWRADEATLRKGMALDPTEPSYPFFLSVTLRAQGRLQAALEAARRAAALDPFWPGPQKALGLYLLDAGHEAEARQVFDRMARLWPGIWATRDGRFWAAALYGEPDAAMALLADEETRPLWMNARSMELWTGSLKALKSNRPEERAAAAAAVKAAVAANQFAHPAAVMLLVRLGDVDDAFAIADSAPLAAFASDDNTPVFFIASTAPLRRDPRFIRMVAKVGLVDYWRSSGNWPDFCSEPGLPYDCKVEAARLTSKQPS